MSKSLLRRLHRAARFFRAPAVLSAALALAVTALPARAQDAPAGADATRVLLPLVAGVPQAVAPPPPVPALVNPSFDGSGGWMEYADGSAAPGSVIYAEENFPPDLVNAFVRAPTAPRLAWLGGAVNSVYDVAQQVTLPAEYALQVRFDYLIMSADPDCNADVGGVWVDGAPLGPAFQLCAANAIGAWQETAVSLDAYRGRTVSLAFRAANDFEFNSNFFVDNVELCGEHADLDASERCQGAGWQAVGALSAGGNGVSNSSGSSLDPALAVSAQGRPWLAWADNSRGAGEIYVRRWNGMAWEEAPGGSASGAGISSTSADSQQPALAVAPNGWVYAGWRDAAAGNNEIYVRVFNGGEWAGVGGSAAGGGVSQNGTDSFDPALAVAPDGNPWVAWANAYAGDYEVYVRRWNGAAWEQVGAASAEGGGISNNAADSTDPAIAFGADGTPYVAWADGVSGSTSIFVRRWNGAAWVEAGAGSASGGGISNTGGSSRTPTLAVAPAAQGGHVYAAWSERTATDTEIYVRRWNGATWEEVGAGSAAGGGISNSASESLDPAVAIAAGGRATVVWTDFNGTNAEIYGRWWTGSAWAQAGSNAAVGGGISLTQGYSQQPTLAAAPDGTPYVAWSDGSAGNLEIYARRYVP